MTAQEEMDQFCNKMGISPSTVFLIVYKSEDKALGKYAEWKRGAEDNKVRRYIQQFNQM